MSHLYTVKYFLTFGASVLLKFQTDGNTVFKNNKKKLKGTVWHFII